MISTVTLHRSTLCAVLVTLCVCMFGVLTASTTTAAPQLPTTISAYVTDQADMLSAATEQKLTTFLRQFEQSDSTQIAVVTIPSLQGRALSEYSIELASNTALGQHKHDNGALLLVARDERKIRIEVGKGLEGRLTDLLAGRIIDLEIAPRFKQGMFEEGIVAGAAAMAASVRGEYTGTGSSAGKEKRNPFGWLIMLLFLAPGLLPFGSRRRRSRSIFFPGGFGGGRGGGGFSGGGGGFGGGGASGGW
ncbi:MAG: TPM domain-containing protein [Desulfuromonadaceae bacterium]|nr:TPM domain-containing protein [Desulfuromonadaceae bacterium]